MAETRKRILELVTKVTGAPELRKAEASLKSIDKATKQANRQLRTMNKAAKATANSMKGLGQAVVLFAGARVMGAMISATVEQERAVAQLNATLKSTEGVAGKTSQELQDMAASLQQVTTYGDEAIIGAESLLLTFKQIQGANFDRTLKSVLDVSTAMGQDLKTSALQLGKALNDPVANLGALSRTGIQFTKDQKEVIKSLVATGNAAEAQIIILQELESQFGGSARAARETLGGALKSLNNAFGDLLEADTENLDGMVESINGLNDIITDPGFQSSMQSIVGAIINLAGQAAKITAGVVQNVERLAEALAKTLGGAAPNLADLNKELDRLNDLIAVSEGRWGWLSYTKGDRARMAQRKADIEEEIRLLKDLESVAPARSNSPLPPAPAAAAAVTDTGGGNATGKLEKINLLAKERYETFAKLNPLLMEYGDIMNGLNETIAEEERRYELYKQFNPELVAYAEGIALVDEALQMGVITAEQWQKETESLGQTLADSQEQWSLGQEAIEVFGSSFDTMLDGVLRGTTDLKEGVKNMVKVMIIELGKLAIYQSLVGIFGAGSGIGGAAASLLPKADGGAFVNGTQVFAKGGIVNGPTIFPLSNGAGLMGEAGPEGILPLSRNSSGQLGVNASGMNVTINNNAPGVDVRPRQDDNGLTIDVVVEQVSDAIRSGGNSITNALQDTYSLGRGRATY